MKHNNPASQDSRIAILAFELLTVLLLAFLLFSMYRMNRFASEAGTTYEHLMQCVQADNLLTTGSDILTNAVREYVVSGDKTYRERYFEEAYSIKHREMGLETAPALPNGEKLEKDLVAGMKHSVDLMLLEYHAMRLVTPEEELSSCPPEIRDYTLSDEELAASHPERRKMATRLVFGKEYSNYKEQIHNSLDMSLESAILFYSNRRKDILDRYRQYYYCSMLALAGTPLLQALCFFLMYRRYAKTKT